MNAEEHWSIMHNQALCVVHCAFPETAQCMLFLIYSRCETTQNIIRTLNDPIECGSDFALKLHLEFRFGYSNYFALLDIYHVFFVIIYLILQHEMNTICYTHTYTKFVLLSSSGSLNGQRLTFFFNLNFYRPEAIPTKFFNLFLPVDKIHCIGKISK